MGKQKQVGFVTMGAAAGGKKIKDIGVGMLGYAFMGKAHTNAYKTLPYMIYPPPAIPVLAAVAGRSEAAVNVVGVLRAAAPDRLPGAVIVGAHYDHLGLGGPG